MQQHQVQANQLLAGQAADPFAWQQAQQQLDRAYADYQRGAAEGEADVSQAQNVLDAAHQVLAEVEGRKPQRPYEDGFREMATPEQAQTEQDYADWEAEYADRAGGCSRHRRIWKQHKRSRTMQRRRRCPPRKTQKISRK